MKREKHSRSQPGEWPLDMSEWYSFTMRKDFSSVLCSSGLMNNLSPFYRHQQKYRPDQKEKKRSGNSRDRAANSSANNWPALGLYLGRRFGRLAGHSSGFVASLSAFQTRQATWKKGTKLSTTK